MNDEPAQLERSTGTTLSAIIVLGVLCWIVDTLFCFFTTADAAACPSLTGLLSTKDIWRHVIVLCFLSIFGSHIHYTTKKQREAEEELHETERALPTAGDNVHRRYCLHGQNSHLTCGICSGGRSARCRRAL